MHVIGTAGHVDHGKSTLVEALTGINPDRLKEERDRQMTIDLGFAWLTLPNGEAVGVVDVPGHRDFIENMLAGVGGIDAVLLVVAADEGVMPQTREHLAILDLLQVSTGLIVLTKMDLVDADWLDLVAADVRAAARETVLGEAAIVPVSARTGEGLADLKNRLQLVLAAKSPRPDFGRPRLPIDRVFSLAGFGTVVTGTLLDGQLRVGDEVALLPGDLGARIRGLQTHKTKVETGRPSSRLAINLAGVEVGQLRRGMVVARPGTLTATTLLDAQLRHLPRAALALKHNSKVKFFTGASEVAGTVRLLDRDELAPGETGWVQLALTEPVVVMKGDHFILRRPSPSETIGGGVVANPQPGRRHRRNSQEVLARLEIQERGAPEELLLEALDRLGPVSLAEALAETAQTRDEIQNVLPELLRQGAVLELDGQDLMASRNGWAQFESDLRAALAAYHAAYPLRSGMPREELKSRLGQRLEGSRRSSWNARAFNALVAYSAAAGIVAVAGSTIRLAAHRVQFTPHDQERVSALIADFERDPYNTPSYKDCAARLGNELLAAVLEQGRFTQASPEVLFLSETYFSMVASLRQALAVNGKITVSEVRDLFHTSRKYALALMEYLDAQGVTRRTGDERVLRA
jgi:selenocysteine-specific elongation factor